jgi:hypothetical protein
MTNEPSGGSAGRARNLGVLTPLALHSTGTESEVFHGHLANFLDGEPAASKLAPALSPFVVSVPGRPMDAIYLLDTRGQARLSIPSISFQGTHVLGFLMHPYIYLILFFPNSRKVLMMRFR